MRDRYAVATPPLVPPIRPSVGTFALALTLLTPLCATTSVAEPIQVLLQGDDPQAMREVLQAHGGHLTHELRIIDGIGGWIDGSQLDPLRQAAKNTRVVEDFNPPAEPPERDCPVDGALDIELHGNTARWNIHSFRTDTTSLTGINIEWVESLELGKLENLSLRDATGKSQTLFEDRDSPIALSGSWLLPAGISQLELQFENAPQKPPLPSALQNALTLSLDFGDCRVELPKAYSNNHRDFYYPRVAGADFLHRAGITGKGVGVAILDSGLWAVDALTLNTQGQWRVPAHFNALLGEPGPRLIDASGHGSHMASIIANSDPVGPQSDENRGNNFKGIAPDAQLIPVTAFSAQSGGDFLDIIRGIQWVIENREAYNIRVLNLSISAEPRFFYWEDPLNQAVLKAWKAGLVVVAAAGNEGPSWESVGSPGNNPFVITVGALTDSWTPEDPIDDFIPDFSSRGPTSAGHIKPDVVAPGGHITGLLPPDSALAMESPNYQLRTGEFVFTGSSQAAAVVSGLAALLLEARPELSNDDIKCLLITSALPAINRDGDLAYSPLVQGAGLVNGGRALTLGATECSQQYRDIDAALAAEVPQMGPVRRGEDGSPVIPGLLANVARAPAAKGPSDTRVWGIKAHVERLGDELDASGACPAPDPWRALYVAEREKFQKLLQNATIAP